MDINYLLMLQAFREGAGGCLTEFLSKMTWYGEMNVVLIITALIYWCVSRDIGTYLLMGWSGNRVVNGVLKVTVCAYRPWIRDLRIHPDEAALAAATGYSFPSGHSMNGASLFGGLAIRKDIKTGLRVLCGIMLVLVAFSRNFLGVHTPQDILVGMASGVLVMYLTGRLIAWVEAHPEKDIMVAVIAILIAVLSAVYAALKPYPMDYDAAGNLLVDGMKMANDTFKGIGWLAGFFVGWILERRFVRFSTDGLPMQERFFRLTGGLLGYYVLSLILNPLLKTAMTGIPGSLLTCFLQTFCITFLFPAVFMKLSDASVSEVVR